MFSVVFSYPSGVAALASYSSFVNLVDWEGFAAVFAVTFNVASAQN